jgi:hypothetical protein
VTDAHSVLSVQSVGSQPLSVWPFCAFVVNSLPSVPNAGRRLFGFCAVAEYESPAKSDGGNEKDFGVHHDKKVERTSKYRVRLSVVDCSQKAFRRLKGGRIPNQLSVR